MSSQPRPSAMRTQPHVPAHWALLGDPCPGLASYNRETLAILSASSSPSLCSLSGTFLTLSHPLSQAFIRKMTHLYSPALQRGGYLSSTQTIFT